MCSNESNSAYNFRKTSDHPLAIEISWSAPVGANRIFQYWGRGFLLSKNMQLIISSTLDSVSFASSSPNPSFSERDKSTFTVDSSDRSLSLSDHCFILLHFKPTTQDNLLTSQ